jgi:exosome complex component RRP4
MTEKRKTVIPGEIISSEDGKLPGDGTEKREKGIVAIRYGLADETNGLIKVIPLSGVYLPRGGNMVIGKVEALTSGGWALDIGTAQNAFLPLTEVPMYVNRNALEEVMDLGDMAVLKITEVQRNGITVTFKVRQAGKINKGIVFKINPYRVPRVIGKEGSMINLIKNRTGCRMTVGQNGFVWIKADSIEKELIARQAVENIANKPNIEGLTEEMEKWFEEKGLKEEKIQEKEELEENKSEEKEE